MAQNTARLPEDRGEQEEVQMEILAGTSMYIDLSGGSDSKTSVYNVGDLGSIPGLGRSAGEGNGNPLQYYCLENPMDRGAL